MHETSADSDECAGHRPSKYPNGSMKYGFDACNGDAVFLTLQPIAIIPVKTGNQIRHRVQL